MVHDPGDAALFPRLAEEDVLRLAAYGSEVRLGAGELLFGEEVPPNEFFVVLEGQLEVSKAIGGESTVLAVHERGEFTGDVSLITGRRLSASARAVGDARICRIPDTSFRRVMLENPTVAETVYRAVAGRFAELDAQLQQTARLAALGTMAAGLAHELNNPAAAATRAASRLEEALGRLAQAALTLGEHGLAPAARQTLEAALAQAPRAPAQDGDPLGGTDREEALADWLEARGVGDPWELAGELGDAGLGPEALDALLQAVGAPAAPAALAWLAAGASARALTAEVQEGTSRVATLVGAMRDYTYLDQAPLQEVDVREGLESTLVVLGARLTEGIAVVRDYAPDLPRVSARGPELNQVWTQLIDNALDALGGKGHLRLRTARDGEGVLVEVGDDGPGIAPELQERVFEPFFTTKEVGAGTGMGLDVVRRIVVARHGGEVRLDSRPGDTRVTVRLPLRV